MNSMEIYENYRNILAECTLFRNMAAQEIERCLSHASAAVFRLKKHESRNMPEHLSDLYLVLSGKLNVIQDSGMNISLVHILLPGGCFGISFCTEKYACCHALQAAEPSELLRLSYDGLLSQDDLREKILANLLSLTSQNLMVLAEKINHTQTRSVRVKLSVYLRDQMAHKGSNCFVLDLNRKALAEYLNITYPAMLRELSQMQKEGILQIDGDQVSILDEELLIDRGSEYNIL